MFETITDTVLFFFIQGMKLDYAFKDSLFISSQKWGKYFDAHFIDSDGTSKPIQLHFELVSGGFNNKVCTFFICISVGV